MQSGDSGKLKVEVVEGKNIPPPDGRPTADTYVVLSIVGEKKKTLTEKTKPQKKGLEAPKWAQSFEFSIDHNATELQLVVQDWNRIVATEVLASVAVPVSKDLVAGTAVDKWFPLTKPGNKKTSGELHLKMTFSQKKKKGESKANLASAGGDGRRPSLKTSESVIGSTGTRGGKSEKSDPEIFKYIRENNFDKLCEFMRSAGQMLSVNELDSYGYTPLQCACANKEGDERIIARLLEVPGATPIKSDSNTALHYFCQYYKSPLDADELFQMFIKLGADVNAKNNNNETPIFKAIWNTSIKLLLVEKLLECGAEVNIFNIPHGKSVLHYAVHLQREDLMHLFLKAGADITAKGKTDNKTPLELATEMKQTKMAETLRAVQELHDWLTSIGCGTWKEAFMKKEIYTKQQLLAADLEKPTLEAMGLHDKELRHKLHKAVKSLKKDTKGSETAAPAAPEDSSTVLTRIIADLEAMGIKKNEFILNHKDLEYAKKLGSGAAGDVFKGLFKGIPVAIKVLKESMAEKEVAEFKKEFFILSSVRSPYTVHFFGAAFGQKLEMVMELCARGSLYDVMRDPAVSLGWAQFFAMSLECSLGLEVLHNHTPQIVHRDLKSLNLLVTQDWHVKVCDFGLSRFDTQANDETLHQLRGTMAFCAPEVYHSSKFTPKSDVYSLVIVMWELINRIIKGVYEAPYSEFKHLQYDFQIIISVAKKGIRPTIPPTTPPPLIELLKRGMDADPEKRPSLREFVEKLQQFQKEFQTKSDAWDRALLDGRALARGEKSLSSVGLPREATPTSGST